jgi:hypothetical protein
MRLRFSDEVISPAVTGVLALTRFDGLQYGVPRFSPFCRPQGFPERTSIHFSSNHLLRAAPFFVLRTAIILHSFVYPN